MGFLYGCCSKAFFQFYRDTVRAAIGGSARVSGFGFGAWGSGLRFFVCGVGGGLGDYKGLSLYLGRG